MKYKVKIKKYPTKYQDGGNMTMQQQGGDPQEQIMQVIKAYAQAKGINPQELVSQLQQMNQEQQKQTLMQMYQELQGAGSQDSDMGYNMQTAAYGGQMGYALDLGARRLWMNQDLDEGSKVNNTLTEVPREYANIEAEGGETAVVPEEDETYSHYNIKGKRHTQGGVPLNVPEGTFIFSDTKKMKMGGSVLKLFGKSEKSTKKFTPAQLAKQYDINKYKAILEDPRADAIKKRTAELMIQNYNKKLAQLALVQEGKKGYPQGIPNIAQEYYAKMMQASNVEAQEEIEENPREEMENPAEAMYGGGMMYGGMMHGGMHLKEYKGDEEGSEVIQEDETPSLTSRMTPKTNPYAVTMPESNVPNFRPFNYDTAAQQNQQGINKLGQSSLLSEEDKQKGEFTDEEGNIIGSNVMLKNYMKRNPYTFKIDADKNTSLYNNEYKPVRYGWTTPDKLNLLNSLVNMAGVKKATPFEPTMQFQRPETRYLDPSRALAANVEQMNAARQAAAMFAGPQSRYSFNAGQFGKNAADIIGQYANQNIAIGNQAAQQAANVANQQMQFDAQRAKRLYDAGVISEQQYQNAMRQARTGVLQAYTQGMKNAADLYNLSMTESPYYAIRPGSQTIYFRSGKGMQDFFNKDKSSDTKTSAKAVAEAAEAAGMTVGEYLKFRDQELRRRQNTQSQKRGSYSYSSSYNDDED